MQNQSTSHATCTWSVKLGRIRNKTVRGLSAALRYRVCLTSRGVWIQMPAQRRERRRERKAGEKASRVAKNVFPAGEMALQANMLALSPSFTA